MKQAVLTFLLVLPACAQIRYGQEVTQGSITMEIVKVPNSFFRLAGIPAPADKDQIQVYAKTTDDSVAAFRITLKFTGGAVEHQVLPAHRAYYWQAVGTFWSSADPGAIVVEELKPGAGALELSAAGGGL